MKPLRYKVSVSSDLSLGSVAGLNAHGWNVPPAVPVPAVPTVEYPLPAFWPPGAALGQNKLTRRVTHRRAAIVQDGHDLGTGIPHVALPPGPFNVLTPIHVLFSKRKTVFFEPSIRFEGRFATPCCAVGLPPTPMMSCNDPISMPIATMVTNELLGTVEFGMSPWSYVASFVSMAATIVVDSCFKGLWASKPPSSSPASTGWSLLAKQFGSKLAGGRSLKEAMAKVGLEAALGLGKHALTSGARTVSVPIPGSPFMRTSVKTDADGETALHARLHGVSLADGDIAAADAWSRMWGDGAWGADLG